MGFIRRLIIATAEWTSILSIFVFTYAGGVYGQVLFLYAGDNAYLAKTALGIRGTGIAFIVGAVIAFIVAATATAVLFCLIEIAQNTADNLNRD